MNRFAKVHDNCVVQIIESDQLAVPGYTPCGNDVGPGWFYIGGDWSAPEVPEQPPLRVIPTCQFMDRFSDDELGLIYAMAQDNNAVRGWYEWIGRQPLIDLDSIRVVSKLNQAVAAGKLTQERVDIILA